jgi:hypothetical protein
MALSLTAREVVKTYKSGKVAVSNPFSLRNATGENKVIHRRCFFRESDLPRTECIL